LILGLKQATLRKNREFVKKMHTMLFGLFCFILSDSEATSAPGLIAHPGSPTKGFVSAEYQLHLLTTSEEQSVIFFPWRHLVFPSKSGQFSLCPAAQNAFFLLHVARKKHHETWAKDSQKKGRTRQHAQM
jgi:hypothetical protein